MYIFTMLFRLKSLLFSRTNPSTQNHLIRHFDPSVLFDSFPRQVKILVSEFKEEMKMNTDKTYAEKIAEEYAEKEQSKVVALQKLDRKAKLPATIFTYTFGIIAALVLGVGMCFSMNVLGDGSTLYMVIGIIVGIIGLVMCGINYPIYNKILKSSKKKYANDILALAKEISEK